MAQVWDENYPKHDPMYGKCAQVSVYSGVLATGLVVTREVGDKGAEANWWHVCNIVVREEAQGLFIGVAVVDEMIAEGPWIDGEEGDFVGAFDVAPDYWSGKDTYVRDLFTLPEDMTCAKVIYIGINVRSVVTSEELLDATYTIDGGEPVNAELFRVTFSFVDGYSGGRSVTPGVRTIKVSNPGYIDHTFTISLANEDTVVYEIFLMPSDSRTRAVLNWGAEVEDLDLMVVPVGVKDLDGTPVDWRDQAGDLARESYWYTGNSAHVSWELGESGCFCTPAEDGGNSCTPSCFLQGPNGFPRVSLDRDDYLHGQLNEQNYDPLGPETATFERLLPGDYQIWVSAYPPDDETPSLPKGLSVQVWLGNGEDSVALIDTASILNEGEKWFYAG
jgi:hypothetical protein